jgi:hypothetical protein
MRLFVEMTRGTWRVWAHSEILNDPLYQLLMVLGSDHPVRKGRATAHLVSLK